MNKLLFKINDCFGNLGVSSNYEWNKRIDDKYSIYDPEDDRLFDAISKSGQKAALACALIVFEGIVLRVSKNNDLLDIHQWLEALWAGTIDSLYIKGLKCDYKKFRLTVDREIGPLSASIYTLSLAVKRYTSKSYYVHNRLINLLLLFRHITPDRKVFDSWLSSTLKKMATLAPCPYNYDDLDLSSDSDEEEEYDSTEEIILPREFFINPGYIYTESSARAEIQQFLQSLDYQNNPYLCSPEEMFSNGFRGNPYTL